MSDQAEGRNTERERLINLVSQAADSDHDLTVTPILMRLVRDMLRADAGKDATIERLRYQLRAEHDAYADLGRQIEARDAELAEFRHSLKRVAFVCAAWRGDNSNVGRMVSLIDKAITAAANPVDEGEPK